MPRKSMVEERSEQILDAFERCIARYGLEGSSLERVAEEAELKRTIIRHYIGNRDSLVEAVADRLCARLVVNLEALKAIEAKGMQSDKLVEKLYQGGGQCGFVDVILIEQFIAASALYPEASAKIVEYVQDYTQVIADVLRDFSNGNPKSWDVAYGVTAILFNEASLEPLQLGLKYSEASKYCVRVLVQSLENSRG